MGQLGPHELSPLPTRARHSGVYGLPSKTQGTTGETSGGQNKFLYNPSPQTAGSLEDTPLTFVTTLEQLEALKKELTTVSEFAVDLEVCVALCYVTCSYP